MPARRNGSVRVVFLKEVAPRIDDLPAQPEKCTSHLGISRVVESGSNECSVACPEIAVMVGGTLCDVAVVRRQDRPAIVHLSIYHQQRTFVETDDVIRQIAEIGIVFVYPRSPVILCIGNEFFGTA